jgi:hypothetical protein
MAWTSMHFAVGMCGGGVMAGAACLIFRRGWRLLPLAMTVGGIWAVVPDLPRIFREDFPSLPLASLLGSKSLERWLHSFGDVFFLHQRLDIQPHEYALHGLILVIVLYNAGLLGLLGLQWHQRGNLVRARRRTHRGHVARHRSHPRHSAGQEAWNGSTEVRTHAAEPGDVIGRISHSGSGRVKRTQ